MSWRAAVSIFVLASMAAAMHGLPAHGTLAAFTASDGASGSVRAGRWPASTSTPDPCIGPPPEHRNMCILVPVRGSSGPLPPLPPATATPPAASGTLGSGLGFFLPPPPSPRATAPPSR